MSSTEIGWLMAGGILLFGVANWYWDRLRQRKR